MCCVIFILFFGILYLYKINIRIKMFTYYECIRPKSSKNRWGIDELKQYASNNNIDISKQKSKRDICEKIFNHQDNLFNDLTHQYELEMDKLKNIEQYKSFSTKFKETLDNFDINKKTYNRILLQMDIIKSKIHNDKNKDKIKDKINNKLIDIKQKKYVSIFLDLYTSKNNLISQLEIHQNKQVLIKHKIGKLTVEHNNKCKKDKYEMKIHDNNNIIVKNINDDQYTNTINNMNFKKGKCGSRCFNDIYCVKNSEKMDEWKRYFNNMDIYLNVKNDILTQIHDIDLKMDNIIMEISEIYKIIFENKLENKYNIINYPFKTQMEYINNLYNIEAIVL
jgi:hypothetical protein